MNKLLVVLLAVCLVSVHAFVKRDTAPAAAQPSALDTIQKDVLDLTEKVKNEFTKALDPEKIKADVNSMIDKLQEVVKTLSSPAAPQPEAPKA